MDFRPGLCAMLVAQKFLQEGCSLLTYFMSKLHNHKYSLLLIIGVHGSCPSWSDHLDGHMDMNSLQSWYNCRRNRRVNGFSTVMYDHNGLNKVKKVSNSKLTLTYLTFSAVLQKYPVRTLMNPPFVHLNLFTLLKNINQLKQKFLETPIEPDEFSWVSDTLCHQFLLTTKFKIYRPFKY